MQGQDWPETLDVRHMPLDEWLEIVCYSPNERGILNVAFPSDEHPQAYVSTVAQRSDDDVLRLLYNFLVKSGTFGFLDQVKWQVFKAAGTHDPEMFRRMARTQFYRRLAQQAAGQDKVQPWEGVTWILDLLPHFPRLALEGLHAYTVAHIQLLPDWPLHGLFDAAEVIRAKYIGLPGTEFETISFLLDLGPRDFECLVERLYRAMGSDTELTPPQRDGGRDINARRQSPGRLEHFLIECKRYSDPVDVKVARAVLGTVSDEKLNKGVLVTTSRFTRGARELSRRNPRLELISGHELIRLLNEYLGPHWSLHIERLVTESERDNMPQEVKVNE